MHNDVAHGNKFLYNLGANREEYKLLNNHLFAMRLML